MYVSMNIGFRFFRLVEYERSMKYSKRRMQYGDRNFDKLNKFASSDETRYHFVISNSKKSLAESLVQIFIEICQQV